ncbi:MAG: hypothetical protein LBG46_07325 [Elusimicrobiota bacterium]|jgi:hypothetical protein|nr:hypothetical protein [Elusimicrobiota bacterium]
MDKFIESGGEYLGEERGLERYKILHKKKLRELQEEWANKGRDVSCVESYNIKKRTVTCGGN